MGKTKAISIRLDAQSEMEVKDMATRYGTSEYMVMKVCIRHALDDFYGNGNQEAFKVQSKSKP
jgi:hypothetical protein